MGKLTTPAATYNDALYHAMMMQATQNAPKASRAIRQHPYFYQMPWQNHHYPLHPTQHVRQLVATPNRRCSQHNHHQSYAPLPLYQYHQPCRYVYFCSVHHRIIRCHHPPKQQGGVPSNQPLFVGNMNSPMQYQHAGAVPGVYNTKMMEIPLQVVEPKNDGVIAPSLLHPPYQVKP